MDRPRDSLSLSNCGSPSGALGGRIKWISGGLRGVHMPTVDVSTGDLPLTK